MLKIANAELIFPKVTKVANLSVFYDVISECMLGLHSRVRPGESFS